MSNVQNVSRRDFLKLVGISSGGLVLATTLPGINPAFAVTNEDAMSIIPENKMMILFIIISF